MKTKQEIDELYHKCWDDFSNKYDDNLHYYSFVEGYTQCQEDMVDNKYTEEDNPNPKLIDSMAMRYRHDFGLLDKQQQDSIRTTMIQLWEEVVGKGFY